VQKEIKLSRLLVFSNEIRSQLCLSLISFPGYSNNPSNMALEETSGSSSHADPSFSLCPIISQTSGGLRAAYVPNEFQKYLQFPISLSPRISPTSGGLPAAYGPNEVQKDLQFPGFWDHSNGQNFLEPLRVSSNEAGKYKIPLFFLVEKYASI
jgi:hypothetical protein